MNLKCYIRHDPAILGTQVYLISENPDGSTDVVLPMLLNVQRVEDGGYLTPEPTLQFDRRNGHEFLQSPATALVDAGFQPDELKVKKGEIDHLRIQLARSNDRCRRAEDTLQDFIMRGGRIERPKQKTV